MWHVHLSIIQMSWRRMMIWHHIPSSNRIHIVSISYLLFFYAFKLYLNSIRGWFFPELTQVFCHSFHLDSLILSCFCFCSLHSISLLSFVPFLLDILSSFITNHNKFCYIRRGGWRMLSFPLIIMKSIMMSFAFLLFSLFLFFDCHSTHVISSSSSRFVLLILSLLLLKSLYKPLLQLLMLFFFFRPIFAVHYFRDERRKICGCLLMSLIPVILLE